MTEFILYRNPIPNENKLSKTPRESLTRISHLIFSENASNTRLIFEEVNKNVTLELRRTVDIPL